MSWVSLGFIRMIKGPAVGKNIRFLDSERYPHWAQIIRSDVQQGIEGWIVELDVYDEEDEIVGTEEVFVKADDIDYVEEYPSDGDKELVVYGKPGDPTVTETDYDGVTITEVDFDADPQKLGEVCICADADGLRDLANFFLEQAEAMDRLGESYDHAHYRNNTRIWPEVVVSKIHPSDRTEAG